MLRQVEGMKDEKEKKKVHVTIASSVYRRFLLLVQVHIDDDTNKLCYC